MSGEVIAPSFCASCTEPRRGLTPVEQPDVHGRARTVYLCVDCLDLGVLADLKQHDLRDEASDYSTGVGHDGNRSRGGRAGSGHR